MALVAFNKDPSARQLRQFGAIGLLVLGALGASAYWRASVLGISLSADAATTTAYALWGAAGACGLLAAVAPPALKWAFLGLSIVALPIGFVLSYVLLFSLYYFLFTPLGLGMRVFGWDPMMKKIDKDAASYWIRRGPPAPPRRYFNQY
jgi:hypothetical protein